MHDIGYVIVLRNPFEKVPCLLISCNESTVISHDVSSLSRYPKVVSYGFSLIADQIRIHNVDIPYVFDIETAKKLLIGQPKSFFKEGAEPWSLKALLASELEESPLRWLDDFLKLRGSHVPTIDVATALLNAFTASWLRIVKDLNSQDEAKRFFNVEAPVYNVFLNSEIKGIHVSKENLITKLEELTRQQYSAYKKLELLYGFLSQKIKPQMKWDDISKYSKLKHISEELDYDFWEYASIYSEYDPFLLEVVAAWKAAADFSTLIKYTVDQYQRVYPRYDVMGTVTGRILISSPGIQYLRKTSRSIFIPTAGYKFIYADFNQFEPGIIASLSNDKLLLKSYNDGDVYEQLSYVLFGNNGQRKISKVIFLAYIYGMSRERLERLIVEIAGEDKKTHGIAFFDKYSCLCKWKEKLCESAIACGYASTMLGNKRYLKSIGSINSHERRWIPNQTIQGTASLIFKKGILRLANELPNARFLVPMHDGILLEVPDDEFSHAQSVVESQLVNEFQIICPNINVGVSFEDFAAV